MSNLKLLALLLVVGNLDCMQQKQPTGKDSSLAGAIAAVAVTGLLYYRQNYKKQQLGSAACGSSQYDPESQAGFCEDVYPNCPRAFKGLTYSKSSVLESCSVEINTNFIDSVKSVILFEKESLDFFIRNQGRFIVVEDTYLDGTKKIRLGNLMGQPWAIGAAIESYTLAKNAKQESLLKLELVNSEQRADIMEKNRNAVLPFIHPQDIETEQKQQEEQQSRRSFQEEQQSRRSFMGVIRNAASYVASWFKRS